MRVSSASRTASASRFAATLVACAFVLLLALPATAMAQILEPTAPASATPLFDLNDARLAPGAPALPHRSLASVAATSGDYRIESLLSGSTLGLGSKAVTHTVTYSFYSDAVFGGAYSGSETGVREVSQGVKANVRAIFAWYSSIVNIDFVEVAETSSTAGTLRIMLSNQPSYAYSYYPWSSDPFSVSSDVHLSPAYDKLDPADTNGFQNPPGSHGYAALAHEIGHGLGLKHSFEGTPSLPAAEDNTANTIMSYSFMGADPATPMAYDVAALQYLYGARAKNTGNDTYKFTSRGTSQYVLGTNTWQVTSRTAKQTLWDSAGYDTLDASALPAAAAGYKFDMRGGGWLVGSSQEMTSSDGKHYFEQGSSLAFTFTPERIVNSGSSDRIIANSAANTFAGYSAGRVVGNDRIEGATPADTLDLTAYPSAAVSKTASGADLLLGLGAPGTVTIVGYFSGNTPVIAYMGAPANQTPVARISTSATSGLAPLSVSFDASASSDPDGSIQSFEWSFSDGTSSTGPTASKVYSAAGSFTATLTVTDNLGATATTSTSITVATVSPPDAEVGTLAGTIRWAGQPLAGVTVSVAGQTTATAADGTYSLSAIAPGTYVATFAKPGYMTQTRTVDVIAGGVRDETLSLARQLGSAVITRTPNKSVVSYTRKRGVAKFALTAAVSGWSSTPVAGRIVYLQSSKAGRVWTNTYALRTDALGKASRAFSIKAKQVRYYRWYVPATPGLNLPAYSAKTKVTVK